MYETILAKNTIHTIDMAFDAMERQHAAGVPPELSRFPHAPVTTTCKDIPNRQVDYVDTGDAIVLWGKLSPEAWVRQVDLAETNGGSTIEQVALPDNHGGTIPFSSGRPPRAKRLDGPGIHVDYIYHEEYRGYDGMFRVVVDKNNQSEADLKQLLETGFNIATGEAVYNPSAAEESERDYTRKAYAEQCKIGDITTTQPEEATSQLAIEMTANGRTHPVDLGRKIDDEIEGLRHEFHGPDDIIGMLLDGELLSAEQRMITGSLQMGRSTGLDILYGGSDSVYTYIQHRNVPQYYRRPVAIFNSRILQRLDLRGYDEDAYGSRERQKPNPVDVWLDRPVMTEDHAKLVMSYERRLDPQEYTGKLGYIRELCVETSIGTEDLKEIVVPGGQTNWFHDTKWATVLCAYSSSPAEIATVLYEIADTQGSVAGADYLTEVLGMPREQAEYYLSGVGLPSLRDRLLRKCSILGITEVAGRALKDVIIEGAA